MERKSHWEEVYARKASTEVSWYQPRPTRSWELIQKTGIGRNAPIIDVGGGASTLVDTLLDAGFSDLTVLDISGSALQVAQARLGARANAVKWLEADITKVELPRAHYDLWHDRAVFHFLTDPADRALYIARLRHAVRPGGHVIVATFAEDGPLQCSNLDICRYSAESLHAEFGGCFSLVESVREEHPTPAGKLQKFVYCYCRMD